MTSDLTSLLNLIDADYVLLQNTKTFNSRDILSQTCPKITCVELRAKGCMLVVKKR